MKSVAAILLLLVARITAQASVCKDVAPGNDPSTDPSPFLIEVFKNHPNGTYKVSLISLHLRHGFTENMMMAFVEGDETEPIGEFSSPSKNIQVVDCPGLEHGGVTHIKRPLLGPKNKLRETVEWTPSEDFNGTVVFKATFVANKTTYWTDVTSKPIIIPDPITTTTTTTRRPTTPSGSEMVNAFSSLVTLCSVSLLLAKLY